MRFPNAALGVKRIFTAEILSLIAAILGALTVMGAAFTAGVSGVAIASSGNVASGASLASLGFTAIFGIATLVLTVIAFFMKLFGVNKAVIAFVGKLLRYRLCPHPDQPCPLHHFRLPHRYDRVRFEHPLPDSEPDHNLGHRQRYP